VHENQGRILQRLLRRRLSLPSATNGFYRFSPASFEPLSLDYLRAAFLGDNGELY
jgi:hypothetical protein